MSASSTPAPTNTTLAPTPPPPPPQRAETDTPPTSSSRSSSRRRAIADEHNARSFSRLDPSPSRSIRSTHTHPLVTDIIVTESDGASESPLAAEDGERTPMSAVLPEKFDELPAEIIALTDRFLEGLTAKTHPAPLTVLQLSSLFQDFYALASTQISTHVSSLYLALKSKNGGAGRRQELLSIEEITQKRRDRRALEVKRLAMEEAVEKKVTEAVYERIWRHRSSDDEPRDEMLRSKIQALNVVGVKLSHLGMGKAEDDAEMMGQLKGAREAFVRMSEEKSPLGKLNVLREIHKNIVDVLTSSAATSGQHSSADQILPTLIFTLLQSPSNTTVVSDILFIQRFRCSNRLDGEAAYCLTNLEASIAFLETVDLASLHIPGGEEVKDKWPTLPPDEPAKPITGSTVAEAPKALPTQLLSTQDAKPTLVVPDPTTASTKPHPALSLLTPVEFVGTTVVATADHGLKLGSAVVSTADQSLKTLGSTLESSYRFLVGKMQNRDVALPRTLEDARKLVDNPPETAESDLSTLFADSESAPATLTAEPLARTDSAASHSSVASTSTSSSLRKPKAKTTKQPPAPIRPSAHSVSSAPIAAFAAVGSSLGKFAGLGMRGFQRATGSGASTPAAGTGAAVKDPILKAIAGSDASKDTPTASTTVKEAEAQGRSSVEQTDLLTAFPDLAGVLPAKKKPELNERFMSVGFDELRMGEVGLLLEEYRRLAEYVRGLP